MHTHIWGSLVARTIRNLPTMQETQVQYLGREDTLGEGNGYLLLYSCWRILWTEEPGGQQSTGSQRVGHN